MNIFKSKIFFGIIFVLYVFCVFTYGNNTGLQAAADNLKKDFQNSYSSTSATYQTMMSLYKEGTDERNLISMVCQIIAVPSLIFIIYYLSKNLK